MRRTAFSRAGEKAEPGGLGLITTNKEGKTGRRRNAEAAGINGAHSAGHARQINETG